MTTLHYKESTERPVQIGLIVLQADETFESDMRHLLPPDVEMLVSRVPSGTELTSETIAEMEDHLTGAAALLPRGARLAAVGYGCTSASAQIGAARVGALIRAGVATTAVTEPVSALVAACAALRVGKIGLISPYVAQVSDQLRVALQAAGVETTAFASFEESREEKVVRISERSIFEAAVEMGQQPEVEAVFLSCTNLRTLGVIAKIEEAIGKPVLSSNQVLAWHLLHLIGVAPPADAPGQLFSLG